jgi:hypothetical protein
MNGRYDDSERSVKRLSQTFRRPPHLVVDCEKRGQTAAVISHEFTMGSKIRAAMRRLAARIR